MRAAMCRNGAEHAGANPGSASASSSSGGVAAAAPVPPEAEPRSKRLRIVGKQTDANASGACSNEGADVDFDSAWFAARKSSRPGGLHEVASLRDVVCLMKPQKSKAAEKHLDDRINVWVKRYQRTSEDWKGGIEAFGSKTGGGSGGIGVSQRFAQQIWAELLPRK